MEKNKTVTVVELTEQMTEENQNIMMADEESIIPGEMTNEEQQNTRDVVEGSTPLMGRTTFEERQQTKRLAIKEIYSEPAHYHALERIILQSEDICSVIMYFVTEYSKNRVFQTPDGVFCLNDSYRYALRSNLKRFYDFENRAGQGDWWFDGILNPRVVVNEVMGSLALSLPRLVALQWLIKNKFDTLFWQRFGDIQVCYNAFLMNKKSKYTETHKKKKKLLRQKIEASVLKVRDERKATNELKKKQSRKRKTRNTEDTVRRKETRLSRIDRRLVVEMITTEKQRMREISRAERAKAKKREVKTKTKQGCMAMDTVEVPLVLDF